MWRKSLIVAAALSAAMFVQADETGKLSGVLFGDLYSFGKHNDAAIQGKQGFWIRRITLAYDRKIDEKLSVKFQIEGRDTGDFTASQNMLLLVRDAWVRLKDGRDVWTIGLIPTPSWDVTEQKLAYRATEKSPLELYRMGSSRDRGVSFATSLDKTAKTGLVLAVGNGNGQRSGDGESAVGYMRVTHALNKELTVNLYGDVHKRVNQEYWRTAKADLFYVSPKLKAGLELISQHRSLRNAADLNLKVISLYLEGQATAKARPFVRFDTASQIPDADRIDYYRMSKDGKPTFVMVGVRMRLHPNFEIVPSFTNISYQRGSGGIKPKSDQLFRVTFHANF